ncbi:MAG: FAD-dependent thymidylate synthase [Deinococcales bacterium]
MSTHQSTYQGPRYQRQRIDVLNHGHVTLIDHMGDDSRIVQAARVSYGDGTKSVREDKGLIDYLMRHRHTSPFEQVIFTFHLKMPIFVARQFLRHRTASLNEISGRYSVMRDEFYLPDSDNLRYQAKDNKQGRSDELLPETLREDILKALDTGQVQAYQAYEALLEQGLARELARIELPLSLYTEMYWQMDLHNLFHFLSLRLDSHAQYEIRVYAEAIASLIQPIVPFAYEAFEEHILYGKRFSKAELEILLKAIDQEKLQEALSASPLRASRRQEFLDKLS